MPAHPYLPRVVLTILLLTCSITFAADKPNEPGALLRDGTWDGGVGTYLVPEILGGIKPDTWPIGGWMRLTLLADRMVITPERIVNQSPPAFLQAIVGQINHGESNTGSLPTPVSAPTTEEPRNEMYLRVPAAKLEARVAPVYRFKNGTNRLSPKLDHRYELTLGAQPFAFTVQNGLRGKNGAAYGEGAHYTIEYDGKKFEYSLGQFGWDSHISAITDIDGDGKPDFVIYVGGSNSSFEAVLLSSVARPGKNPATASLHSTGC